jgi:small subunit ribosomal protein S6
LREHAADSQIRDYEMMVVVTPTVTEDGLQPVIDRVSGYITDQGGTVDSTNSQNPWGRRRLAYEIQDHNDAFYVLYRFHAIPEAITEIEREIKLDEQVIRYLVVRYDEMTEHEERPQGGRRGDAAPAPAPAPAPRQAQENAPAPAPQESPSPEQPNAAAEEATTTEDTEASTEPTDSGEQAEEAGAGS